MYHIPPTTTHSPYTTLFRSHPLIGVQPPNAMLARTRHRHQGLNTGCGWFRMTRSTMHAAVHHGPAERCDAPVMVDRKSTRLNSSHLGISYAVFCLKKKNTKR